MRPMAKTEQTVACSLDPDRTGQGTVDQQGGQDQDYQVCDHLLDNMHAALYRYSCYKGPVWHGQSSPVQWVCHAEQIN